MFRTGNRGDAGSIRSLGFWLFSTGALSLLLTFSGWAETRPDSWQATLTTSGPGSFPPPRPLHATYRFAWSGFSAASADASWNQTPSDRLQLTGTAQTNGLVRALWKLDVKYTSVAEGKTLRPISVNQIENIRSKKIVTDLAFDARGVTSRRTTDRDRDPKAELKEKRFSFANLFDLQSSLLYVRSQPLENQNGLQLVVYPANSAYLATVKVLGREKLSIRAGNYKAIKLDLQLHRIGKNGELEPHRKFRRATVWFSDDADRMILRIEAQIFVGTVSAELQSVRFDEMKSAAPAGSPPAR